MNKFPRPKAKAKEPSTDNPQDPHRKQRVLYTWEELQAQGAIIEKAVNQERQHLQEIVTDLEKHQINRIIITGCGDSWITGMGVRSIFERLLKIPTEAMQAFDLGHYFFDAVDEHTLVIGISSSGSTRSVIEALDRAEEKGAYTIGMSNTVNSPIMANYSNHILVRATRHGWPTQASTAAMAVLTQFAILLAQDWQTTESSLTKELDSDLAILPVLIDEVIEKSKPVMQELAKKWVKARYILFCGAGSNIAPAAFGCAKVKELSPVHALLIPMEEFHHYRTIKPGDPLILVAPDAAGHKRAVETAEIARYDGGQVFALTPKGEQEISNFTNMALGLPDVNDFLKPILYSIPLQIFAFYFAMEKFEHNLGFERALPKEPTQKPNGNE